MDKVTISDAVKYIGVDDTDLDLFEGQYIIPNGVSYNSYVILDEKTAVMDTVDARKSKEWFENLKAALDGRTVDYLVISHLEPDHASNVKALADAYPDAKLVLSVKAKAMLPQFFDIENLEERAIAEQIPGITYVTEEESKAIQADVVVEAVGTPQAVSSAVLLARPGGSIVLMGNPSGRCFLFACGTYP